MCVWTLLWLKLQTKSSGRAKADIFQGVPDTLNQLTEGARVLGLGYTNSSEVRTWQGSD